jgi:hypothetical protein
VEATVAILMILMLQGVALALLFTFPKSNAAARWFYLPSLALGWLGYIVYESIYIPRHCSGDCSIRVDLLFIWPYLAYVTICAIAYFLRREKK